MTAIFEVHAAMHHSITELVINLATYQSIASLFAGFSGLWR